MNPKTKIDMGAEIRKILIKQNRSVNWLADELGCDQSNLNKKLQKAKVDPDLLPNGYENNGVLLSC